MRIEELNRIDQKRIDKGHLLLGQITRLEADKKNVNDNGVIVLIPDRNSKQGGTPYELPCDIKHDLKQKIIGIFDAEIEYLQKTFDKL